ncbi:copper chaperone PCu(A)C [Sphingomonas sp.]|uniref:copper chaperone PCu(A)C n=1 Tax=Sphingomonas sp. TaxID=28214 RepID=UPI003CC575FA
MTAAMMAGLAALGACGKPAQPSVDGAWVRLPAVPGRPAAAYFTLHGGSADVTLVGVGATGAARAELHESMANGMRPLAGVPVAAGASVTFAPGGKHVMLFAVDPRLTPGKTMPLQLHLADRELQATAMVLGAADPAP